MKLWQQAMISLARSDTITGFVQRQRRLDSFARRFVGGNSIDDALDVAELLRTDGITASLFFLGEYESDPDVVDTTVDALEGVIQRIGESGHDVCVSVDPTQIGLMIDPATCTHNARRLADAVHNAAQQQNPQSRCALMIDMEDASVTDYTLELHRSLHANDKPVAITIQGYLDRTNQDLRGLVEHGPWVRLVKGAFAEPRDIAARRRRDIDTRYHTAAKVLLAPDARAAGCYPSFGTHDDALIDEIIVLAEMNGWEPHEYEFEMLLGVRPELQRRLARNGQHVRVYLPFGQDWFPYAIRRVGESPRNLRFAAHAVAARTGNRS